MNDNHNPLAQALDTDSEQFLTFMLGDEEYGINILKVQEIRGWDSVTPIPNTPDYVLGVVNLRGIVIPVVDLRVQFSLSNAEFTSTTVIIIVKVSQGHSDRTVGLVVDSVADVYDIDSEEMQDAPGLENIIATEFITGLAHVDEKMLILLNIDKLVNLGVLQLDDATDTTETA